MARLILVVRRGLEHDAAARANREHALRTFEAERYEQRHAEQGAAEWLGAPQALPA